MGLWLLLWRMLKGQEALDQQLHAAVLPSNDSSPRNVWKALDRGADPNVLNAQGLTPLHVAAGTDGKDAPRITRQLLRFDANMSATNDDGKTPLHIAAGSCGSHAAEVAKALLLKGAPVEAVDNKGWTALRTALASENENALGIVSALLQKAAVNEQDSDGLMTLHWAVRNQTHAPQLVRLLLESGAEVRSQDSFGWTPLHLALRCSQDEALRTVRELLVGKRNRDPGDRGALDSKDASGWTPLHCAVRQTHRYAVDMVQEILKCNPDVNVVDKFGDTPLLSAVMNEHVVPMVKALRGKDADQTKRDLFGSTPHGRLVASGNTPALEQLQQCLPAPIQDCIAGVVR
eukprot:TRINITY_DN4694_c0_g1_i6.p1 TRINITY_DN4694_c0_g1~~TRINITY_DN4694_c0_g1_i6.p1  ORF type:complete len:346 (+),score=44.70 TRINITY_DN4694_c0_g1_i6:61-1098(+)